MNNEFTQSQEKIFDDVVTGMFDQIGPEMTKWGFVDMLSQFEKMVRANSQYPDNLHRAVRSFCRHYMGMSGLRFREAQAWLAGKQLMPAERIQQVLLMLMKWQEGGLKPLSQPRPFPSALGQGFSAPAREAPVVPAIPERSTFGAFRTTVELGTTLFNSYAKMVLEAGINPSDVFDSDRIQWRGAVSKIAKAYGVKVIFPGAEKDYGQPLTRKDLQDGDLFDQPKKKTRRSR